MSDLPLSFPHDTKSAKKTARAGVLTAGDLITEDQFSIMTRASQSDVATHNESSYVLDEDSSNLVETARSIVSIDNSGTAAISLNLLRTDGVKQTMNQVMSATAVGTTITAVDASTGDSASASFTNGGLMWDNDNSCIYLGQDIFRIQFIHDSNENGGVPSLRIQAKQSDGTYETKWSVSQV